MTENLFTYQVRVRARGLGRLIAVALCGVLSTAGAQDAPPYESGGRAVQVGDRVVLSVADEPGLTDTFTVTAGPAITLPQIGTVSLSGVLRRDIQTHLTTEIARFIKEPVVSAQALVRVAVLGQVARPGFFALRSDALLSDAITVAGGLTADAEMKKAKLSRSGTVLQEGARLHNSFAAGRTIDELGMNAGDELMIPRRYDSERTIRILGLIVAIPLTAVMLLRM